MKIKSLSHVGITVKDLDATIKWYWEVFKLPVVSLSGLEKEEFNKMENLYKMKNGSVKFAFLLCPGGKVIEVFEFSEKSKFDHSWSRPGTTHFTLDVKNITKWYDKLLVRDDVEILCPPQNTDGNEWFFFRDPNGVLIELIDLKFNYFLLNKMTRFVGWLMRKTQFKDYYKKSK